MQITPEAWVNWKNDPTTKEFLQYLSDFKDQIAQNITLSLVSGIEPPPELIKEVALRCQIIGDIQELVFDDIEEFYKKEGDENDENTGA